MMPAMTVGGFVLPRNGTVVLMTFFRARNRKWGGGSLHLVAWDEVNFRKSPTIEPKPGLDSKCSPFTVLGPTDGN